ncbi:MAG: alpha/beta hydrolase [Alphaproteobacteria bacterium]|nr:alpha/beta hydrolase [Alphaproteobacteria bacterium]MDE2163116.1 alpha/beta hydrolase [Alphaproteobacteria bacterium]MDE2500343.1 alpha/beta hydrolase [Alphaproteobacteria bacterium]
MTELSYLRHGDGQLAYRRRDGKEPGIVWLGGFMSDMTGTKAQAVDAWAARSGRACLRFDYSGHGRSSGAFTDGTISRWRDDALAAIDAQSRGPQILVGSSMGGWIAMLVARLRPERVAGILLIAPAADMTEALMWQRMPEDVRRQIAEQGLWLRPSDYGDGPYPITRALIEDGRRNLILGEAIAVSCPVRILQGMADPDVPWQHAMKLAAAIDGDVVTTLVKNGDHRLSTPPDIRLLERTLDALIEDVGS